MEQKAPSSLRIFLYFLCTNIVAVLAVTVGLICQFLYWLLYDSFGRYVKRSKRRIKYKKSDNYDEYYAVIIGTGFSGIGMAIKLNKLGIDDYILIERHGRIGGAWYANQYPGCACDVPSNLYSFSFEPNPNWSHYFSRQAEIAQYLEHCTDTYDVRRHIHFNRNVTELRWLEDKQLWKVTTQSDEEQKAFYARVVIAGSGPLSNPSYPNDILGADKFQGETCHTSNWNGRIELKNKHVAVIGTGASAIQVVPAVQQMDVNKLLVFQRTPPWVVPRNDRTVSKFEKMLFEKFPILQKLVRRYLYWSREAFLLSFVYRLPLRFVNQTLVKYNLDQQVKDVELRRKVTPKWDLGCKRVLVTSDWYPTLQKPNVSLITSRIQEIKSNSILTNDGVEHPVDIIIWATGFQTQKFCIPVYGMNECSLAKQWSETMQAYRGVAVPNFPNLFILLGPNSRLGHSSAIIMLEAQLKYVVETLVYMDENNISSVSIKQSVHDEYNKWIQSKLKRTVWYSGGCQSWYQDAKGNVTTIWPDFTWIYRLLLDKFDYKNYILQKQ